MVPKKALSKLRILEMSRFVAGAYCGKLLADLGAEVIKIEPAGCGDETRRYGPFKHQNPNPEASGIFLYLNTNKFGITLDTRKEAGRQILQKLLKKADVLIIEDTAETISGLGLKADQHGEMYPQLIIAAITPFGLSGPYSNYKAYYLNTFGCGGEGYFLPSDKGYELYPDRPPVRMGGFTSEYNAGVATATAILASLFRRRILNYGEFIDVSKQEVLLNLVRFELCVYNEGAITSRATRAWPIGGLMLCQDGWILLLPLNETLWNRLLKAMGNPEWSGEAWAQYSYVTGTYLRPELYTPELYEAQARVNDRLQEWCSHYTKHEITRTLQEAGTVAGPINDISDVVNSEQLKLKNFFVEVEHPIAGGLKYPCAPYIMGATPTSFDRPAPLLGQHNRQVLCELIGYTEDELVRLRKGGVI